MPRSWLRGIELAQWHRAGSIFLAKKKNSQKLSQLRHVELADECESIKTNTSYVLAGFMTHWRAGSRACSRLNFCEVFFSFFFSLKKLSQLRGAEPATRRWASYVALSQLRGTEPATWHWASKVALSFELARRQWASKVALSFIIQYQSSPQLC